MAEQKMKTCSKKVSETCVGTATEDKFKKGTRVCKNCLTCMQTQYYEKNREKILEKNKKAYRIYYQEHKEQKNAYMKEYMKRIIANKQKPAE